MSFARRGRAPHTSSGPLRAPSARPRRACVACQEGAGLVSRGRSPPSQAGNSGRRSGIPEGVARMAPEARSLPRVLVVDDDRLNREIVRDALAASAQVVSCASGEAALEALEHEPADLVLSDLTMPGIPGTALPGRLRREHPDTDFGPPT